MNYLKNLSVASLAFGASQAFAAVPAEVTTAIGDMKTDGLAVAAAVTVAIIVVAAVKFLRRAL